MEDQRILSAAHNVRMTVGGLQFLRDELNKARGPVARYVALAITDLESADNWLRRAYEAEEGGSDVGMGAKDG